MEVFATVGHICPVSGAGQCRMAQLDLLSEQFHITAGGKGNAEEERGRLMLLHCNIAML